MFNTSLAKAERKLLQKNKKFLFYYISVIPYYCCWLLYLCNTILLLLGIVLYCEKCLCTGFAHAVIIQETKSKNNRYPGHLNKILKTYFFFIFSITGSLTS